MKTIAVLDVGGTISKFSSKSINEFYNEKGVPINNFGSIAESVGK